MRSEFSLCTDGARGEAGGTLPESSELGAATFELRNQSIQVLEDIVRRGLERGVFRIAHVWLAVAAIGAMGIRVAYGYTPEFEVDAQQVADIYAQFALRLLGVAEPAHPQTP